MFVCIIVFFTTICMFVNSFSYNQNLLHCKYVFFLITGTFKWLEENINTESFLVYQNLLPVKVYVAFWQHSEFQVLDIKIYKFTIFSDLNPITRKNNTSCFINTWLQNEPYNRVLCFQLSIMMFQ